MLASSTTVLSTALAQEGFEELSGKYTNSEFGIEITFPDGWTGGVFEGAFLQGVVVPGGFNGSEPAKSITLVVAPRTDDSDDPIDPSGMVSFYIGDCDALAIESRVVSGVHGIDVIASCPTTETAGKLVILTSQENLVLLVYESQNSDFEADLAKFEATVDSLKVEGAIDSPLGTGDIIKPTYFQVVTIGGKQVDLKFVTSTGVLDTALDEEKKTLTFKVFGEDESTIVLVGAVLEGPYMVMIDGAETANVGESISYPGVNTLTVSHGPGEHEISITGTQVVPEFPYAVLLSLSAVIGTIIVLSRIGLGGRLYGTRM